jgi:hypothetical protein
VLSKPEPAAEAAALAAAIDLRAVVLVEGRSDRAAVEVLAERQGRDLAADGVAVVPMGGATNIRSYLDVFGPLGLGLVLAGLYDVGEEGYIRRGLEHVGLDVGPGQGGLAACGFYVCVVDLEDELIRSLGAPAVEQVVEAQGELASFRTLQKQAPHLGRTTEQQLHRFMGSRGGRKARYARLLVEALELAAVPRPLLQVLARVSGPPPA